MKGWRLASSMTDTMMGYLHVHSSFMHSASFGAWEFVWARLGHDNVGIFQIWCTLDHG